MKDPIGSVEEAKDEVQKAEDASAVDASVQRAEAALDALDGVRKPKGLPEPVRVQAEAPLLEELKEAIRVIGKPVARSNTVYALVGDTLHSVSIDPKSLIRV